MINVYKLEARERSNQTAITAPRSAKIDDSLERLSWLMDDLIKIPGLNWRFGVDALVGLIPGFGDTATSLVSFYILVSAVRYGVPKVTLLRMGMNLGIDYLVGSFPVVGDIFDVWWKSNQRNVDLISKRATVSAEEAREGKISDWLFIGVIIFALVALAIGSALASLYLLTLIAGRIF